MRNKKGKSKTTVLISYNSVKGFKSGWHANKKLYICANDIGRGKDTGRGSTEVEKAGSVMHSISGSYYNGSVPVEKVEHYYVYAGLNAMNQAVYMATSLKKESSAPVTVVACNCSSSQKRQILSANNIDIIWSGCGGETTMGRIAQEMLAKQKS